EAEDIARGEAVAEGHRTHHDSEVEWIRWTGTSGFRSAARRGDTVIQVWRPRGATMPTAVYRHAPILHRQDEPTCTRFYVEAVANAEEAALTWGKFKRLRKQVGVTAMIGPNSARWLPEERVGPVPVERLLGDPDRLGEVLVVQPGVDHLVAVPRQE